MYKCKKKCYRAIGFMYKGMNPEELKKFYAAQKDQMAAAKVPQSPSLLSCLGKLVIEPIYILYQFQLERDGLFRKHSKNHPSKISILLQAKREAEEKMEAEWQALAKSIQRDVARQDIADQRKRR